MHIWDRSFCLKAALHAWWSRRKGSIGRINILNSICFYVLLSLSQSTCAIYTGEICLGACIRVKWGQGFPLYDICGATKST